MTLDKWGMDELLNARETIILENKNQGYIECPICSKKLGYLIASNGHVHAKCETKHCLSWME